MNLNNTSTDELIRHASAGDSHAAQELLHRHRAQLKRMISIRMDDRVMARVDPSDVVQETLVEANARLQEFLKNPPLPFFLWLRQLAVQRLEKLHRRHIVAQKRSVKREAQRFLPINDQSSMMLTHHLLASGTSPSGELIKEERMRHVQSALAELKDADREILVLRHLEQLSISEIAALLEISETAVKSRHFRAIQRLHHLLGNNFSEA